MSKLKFNDGEEFDLSGPFRVEERYDGWYVVGNKGNVWNNTAHIYKNGAGNLCGTPALSTNWAHIEKVEMVGCPECLKKYQNEVK